MLLLTTAILGVFLACLAQTSPVPSGDRHELGGVLICNDPNGQGHCEYAVYELEKCYNLPPALINNAATFAPDDAAFYCYPYIMECGGICRSPSGCTLGSVSFDYEHKFNLTEIGWNEYITSFECHRDRSADADGDSCEADV
ncbi:hypothetical protein C8A00DRAFT_16867 [Chaetomidium leptoderma]|uniref:Uncharacterized protein n=1 Tax=Chaetomidium leptoderma TaxID=669021 RepID=A0AAN6ZWV9_9PEZI|nr:hypothetical protein C8A00DRAFT_16867 [Chaetomidium leptoderma]